jgi:hypothetical protein
MAYALSGEESYTFTGEDNMRFLLNKTVCENCSAVEAKLRATRSVLAMREAELLALKGPCSNGGCGLHYAHSGLCG